MAIKTTEPVRTRADQGVIKRTAAEVARDLPAERWRRLSAGDGTKGPRIYDWATEPLIVPGTKDGNHTLLVRRSLTDRDDIALFLVFTTRPTPLEAMVRGAGLRWTPSRPVSKPPRARSGSIITRSDSGFPGTGT